MQPEEGGGSAAQDGFSAGNADDLARFSDSIRRFGADAVVVTSTDQVWALDLRPVVAAHLERGSDCTIVTAQVSRTQAAEKDVVTVGRGSRVTAVDHKPDDPSGTTIAAEVFVYRPEALLLALDDLRRELSHDGDGSTGLGDFGEHLLPRLVAGRHGARLAARRVTGPTWAGRPSSFLAAHRDLLAGRVDAVGRPDWPVLTRWPELPAAGSTRGPCWRTSSSVRAAGCAARCGAACSAPGWSSSPARSSRTACSSRGCRSAATRTS